MTSASAAPFDLPRERLGARDVRTLLLAALGGALEFYDFVVFVFFALPLIGMLVRRFDALAPTHYVAFTALIGVAVAVHSLSRDGSRNSDS